MREGPPDQCASIEAEDFVPQQIPSYPVQELLVVVQLR